MSASNNIKTKIKSVVVKKEQEPLTKTGTVETNKKQFSPVSFESDDECPAQYHTGHASDNSEKWDGIRAEMGIKKCAASVEDMPIYNKIVGDVEERQRASKRIAEDASTCDDTIKNMKDLEGKYFFI